MIEVTKFGSVVPISREQAIDAGLIEPTVEERAELDRQTAEAGRRIGERTAKHEAARRRLAEITDPLARAILDLHTEDEYGECEGCDYTGYEGEPPRWPCRTVEVVADRFGIQVP